MVNNINKTKMTTYGDRNTCVDLGQVVLIGTVKYFHLTLVHYGCILLSSTELCTCIIWIITFV